MFKKILKPFFFLFQPETSHRLVSVLLKIYYKTRITRWFVRKQFAVTDQRLSRRVWGIDFPNPVGLGAGFDKNAALFDELSGLGFGFIEIGTVTPLPQPGNKKPRLFRLPADEALINRMGFNNDGVVKVAARLRKRKSSVIIGGNIGKNKITPNEDAISDYEKCFRELFDVVDYFVVNVSSPNTPGLRSLQEKEPLKRLLLRLQEVNTELMHRALTAAPGAHAEQRDREMQHGRKSGIRRPILLKIAPDLTNEQLDEIIEVVKETGLDGIVATNTTIGRENLHVQPAALEAIGPGGLSGKPLEKRSTEVIRYIHQKCSGSIPIIGVGGVHTPEDAKEKLNAGAILIQLYTGFIYEGPGLVRRINNAL